ncbi:MAG: uracil-DNA glycosylase [Actinomycetia bacterium]|nr:uracil-DNA glycosylase [Actinomycetes bacterium]MCP4844909.1 uracil-DNA glycosylase [Actinomycetes bacterium]
MATEETGCPTWDALIAGLPDELWSAVEEARATSSVFPTRDDVFAALRRTSASDTRVVLLGQDPYPGRSNDGTPFACGMAFATRPGTAPVPASLRNIYTELEADLGSERPSDGDLSGWAAQGVLLLNRTLTVVEGQPASHAGIGWEDFTEACVAAVVDQGPAVGLLLGRHAQRLRGIFEAAGRPVVEAVHPSPLSARRGFFGSGAFSAVNLELEALGVEPVDWALSSAPTT